MGHSQAASRLIKLPPALLLLFAVCLLSLNLCWLLSQAYGTAAMAGLQSGSPDESTIRTAELAVKLSPYASHERAIYARLLIHQERFEALEQYRQALRMAPANALLWQSFVHFKLNISEYDSELEDAMQRVSELAPRSLTLHYYNALQAISYWNWGSPRMRTTWVNSVRYVVKTDPTWFLRRVLLNRQEEILCRSSELESVETVAWCKGALAAREICFSNPPNPRFSAWCNRIGLLAETPK